MTAITDSSDEAEFEGDGENMKIGNRRRRSSRGMVSYKDDAFEDDNDSDDDDNGDSDDDGDDDDDDIPLAALKSPSPAHKKNSTASKGKAPVRKKAKTTTSSNQSTNDYNSPSFVLYGTGSMKGKLIQNLLCRWWYTIIWPDPSSIPKEPPTDYDSMDGFPGVFICTREEEVGTIKDFRDKANSPNFNNLAKKTSEELKELLMKAVIEQKRQLIEFEGPGTSTETELNSMLKWASKLNAKKADREAEKVLKANKLTIPH